MLEELRRQATEGEWFKYTISNWEMILHHFRFTSATIFFSGFWSQGDGACFTGRWYSIYAIDHPRIRKEFEHDDEIIGWLDQLLAMLVEAKLSDIEVPDVGLSRHSRYYHDQTITFDFTYNPFDNQEPDIRFEERLKDLAHSMMQRIYRDLEAEHTYLSSPEAIMDYIDDYRFSEEGDVL